MQYAYPVVGGLPVDMVDTAKIMEVLQPIWNTKTETASSVRGRIENILSWATVQGYREGPKPAMWRCHLSMLLPKRSMVQKVIHHAALPYTDLPKLIRKVRISNSISAMALEFTILTCARTNEIIGAQWAEIDMEAAIWTIPPSRMKAGLEHRVALSNQAISLLKRLPQEADWLFLCLKKKHAHFQYGYVEISAS